MYEKTSGREKKNKRKGQRKEKETADLFSGQANNTTSHSQILTWQGHAVRTV